MASKATKDPDADVITLRAAHETLMRARHQLREDASPEKWLAYRQRAVTLYQRIADVDRFHHHEALYWVSTEREAVDALKAQIAAGKPD